MTDIKPIPAAHIADEKTVMTQLLHDYDSRYRIAKTAYEKLGIDPDITIYTAALETLQNKEQALAFHVSLMIKKGML